MLTILILGISLTLAACSTMSKQDKQGSGCPIKKKTTAIRYVHDTNSGIAVETEYNITADSLTWSYNDMRNGFRLYDVVRYDRADFDTLIDTLSSVSFKVFQHQAPPTVGGGGYVYYFFDDKGESLYFGTGNHAASGNYGAVEEAVGEFIKTHKTKGETVMETLRQKAREEGHPLYFKDFPKELEGYKVE